MSSLFSFNNLSFDRETRLSGRRVFRAALRHTLANKKIFLVPLVNALIGIGAVLWFLGSTFVAMANVQGFENYAQAFVALYVLFLFLGVGGLIVLQAISEATVLAMANGILAGEKVSIGASLATALKHFPKLLIFAMWNLTVGALMRTLQRTFIGSFIGDAVAFAGGLAWAAATYFTLPGVVFEGLGPVEATKRGVQTLKEKWGDAAGPAVFGSGIILVLYLVGSGLLLGPILVSNTLGISVVFGDTAIPVLTVFMAFGALLLALAGMLQATTMAFVKMAIYRYVKGQPVAGLDSETLRGAIRTSNAFLAGKRLNGTV